MQVKLHVKIEWLLPLNKPGIQHSEIINKLIKPKARLYLQGLGMDISDLFLIELMIRVSQDVFR